MFKRPAGPKEIAGGGIEVFSSKTLEKEFFADAPDAPAHLATEMLRTHGVPETTIGRYAQAVRAFFEYPSLATNTGSRMDFSPQDGYFGPKVELGRQDPNAKAMPDLARGLGLKPRLKKEGETNDLIPVEIDGEAVLQKVRADVPPNTPLTPEETFALQINRLMYALHEPIHTVQAINPGDKLNALMDELGTRDVLDPKFAEGIARSSVLLTENAAIEVPVDLAGAFLGAPEKLKGQSLLRNSTMGDGAAVGFLVSEDEATMDYLSEKAVAPWIKKQPAFLLWAHNTLSAAATGLRELRAEAGDLGALDGKIPRDEWLARRKSIEDEATRLNNLVGFVAPAYFSVFGSSAECAPFLAASQAKGPMGRTVGGPIADVPPFDRSELNALAFECLADRHAGFGHYHFPVSGKDHLFGGAITTEGAKIAARLVSAANREGRDAAWVKTFFNDLEAAIELEAGGNTGDGTRTDKAGAIAAFAELAKRAERDLGERLDPDELREMHNIGRNFAVELGETYQNNLTVRKALLDRYEADGQHEELDIYLQAVFYKTELRAPGKALFEIGGLGSASHWGPYIDKAWDFIRSQTRLGAFAVDATRLQPAELAQLESAFRHYYGSIRSSTYGDDLDEGKARRFVQTLAEWKRRQNAEDRITALPNPFAA